MDQSQCPIVCPECGQEFEALVEPVQQCPACGAQFFVTSPDDAADAEASALLADQQSAEQERLDRRRIRAVQLERRSLYRSRTYMLIAALTCLGAAAQLIWLAVENRQVARPMRIAAQVVLAAGLGAGAARFLRRAGAYRVQAERTHLAEPSAKPDFSSLGDGSRLAEQLSDMVSAKTSKDPHQE